MELQEKQNIWEKARLKAYDSYKELGIMASFVGMVDGKVKVYILDTDQISQLLALYDHVNEIPKEYTIYFE